MEEKTETVFEHIKEIRSRVIVSLIAFILVFILSWFFVEDILRLLILPASNLTFVYIDIMEMFGVYMQICFLSALILSSPIILYQIVSFILPALEVQERQLLFLVLPFSLLCFSGGVIFGYYILIPPAIKFLTSFGSGIAVPQLRISNYTSLVVTLLLGLGLVFEVPVITTFLARLGVISSGVMLRQWKWALVVSFVLGAVITPTWDPVNQSLVSIPIFGLYLLSIVLVRLFGKTKLVEGVVFNG